MNKDSKIYISGHNGMVGSAILRRLESEGYTNLLYLSTGQLDLRDTQGVEYFFHTEEPEYVFHCAAKVGGIKSNNDYRAEYLYDNLMIEANVIHSSYENDVKKLLFFGSSCVYPKHAEQPIKESSLLTSSLEYTNEPYAIAKIAGLKLCENYNKQYGSNFISVMPTNLYGRNDNYDLENSHVLPALIRKFHEAKISNQDTIELWGNGLAKREFLYVDDLVDASLLLMDSYNETELINIGTGKDLEIKKLANIIKETVGYDGDILFNNNGLDGTPRKLLDVTKINNLGWYPKTELKDGIQKSYDFFLTEHHK